MRLNARSAYQFVEWLFRHETDFGLFCLGMFAVITIVCYVIPVPSDVATLLRCVRAVFVGFWVVSAKKEPVFLPTANRKVGVKIVLIMVD